MTDEQLTLEPTPTLEGPINTTGTIKDVEIRSVNVPGQDDPVNYADVHIAVDHDELSKVLGGATLKVGYPARVNQDTKLGALLERFGFNIKEQVDLGALIGKAVQVHCFKKEGSDGGMFWRIQRDSVQPSTA